MAGYKEASPGTKETLMRDARLILGMIDDMRTALNSLQNEIESMERYADRLDESEVPEDQTVLVKVLEVEFMAGEDHAKDTVDEWHRPPGH